MPNIAEYNAQGEITPSDKGIQAAETAGRRLGQFGEQTGQVIKQFGHMVEDHMAVMETSELFKTGAELEHNLLKKYEQESADLNPDGTPNPNSHNRNDPHFGDRFMAEVGPQLDSWGAHALTDRGQQLAGTLKANIRNNLFHHVASGQAAMDFAHYQDNKLSFLNTLSAQLIDNPTEQGFTNAQALWKQFLTENTAHIPDVERREEAMASDLKEGSTQLTLARYHGANEHSKMQIGEIGDPTKSTAYTQTEADIAKRLGFEYLTPELQQAVIAQHTNAVSSGQELYKSRQATAKDAIVTEGKTNFSLLHNKAMEYQLAGKPMPPELVAATQEYAQRYGATNPGEASALDDFILRGAKSAQGNEMQPYNPKVRDDIQRNLSRPQGDPLRPTEASLSRDYSHGLITLEDLNHNLELLGKLDKPSQDPTFKPAYDDFKRWQTQMVQSIGATNPKGTGTTIARAQFLHDSETIFMARGRQGDWNKARDEVTDIHKPTAFANMIPTYNRAANRGSKAGEWLRNTVPQFNYDGTITAPGSAASPIYPTKTAPGVHVKPMSSEDLKIAHDAIWGH